MERPQLATAAGRDATPRAARPDRVRGRRGASRRRLRSSALTLAQAINGALASALERHPETLVFGEDVAVKGGVYGVTRGLQARFGPHRVFDTLLDETSILGLALGASVSGLRPDPGDPVPRVPAQRRGPAPRRGGHAPVLLAGRVSQRDGRADPGLRVPEGLRRSLPQRQRRRRAARHPGPGDRLAGAAGRRRRDAATCVAAAKVDGSVCVFLEPIALYHTRDLHEEGDELWVGAPAAEHVPIGAAYTHRGGGRPDARDVGERAATCRSASRGACCSAAIGARVVDLRWLAPLPLEEVLREATATGRTLVVDETRRTGGVGEGIVAELVDAGYAGRLARVSSKDSFVPLGDAARPRAALRGRDRDGRSAAARLKTAPVVVV